MKSKKHFHKRHRLQPRKVEEGDWVHVYDSRLDKQHSTARKFGKWWLGTYLVRKVEAYATYLLAKIDGIPFALPIVGKMIKIFTIRYVNEIRTENVFARRTDNFASSLLKIPQKYVKQRIFEFLRNITLIILNFYCLITNTNHQMW